MTLLVYIIKVTKKQTLKSSNLPVNGRQYTPQILEEHITVPIEEKNGKKTKDPNEPL